MDLMVVMHGFYYGNYDELLFRILHDMIYDYDYVCIGMNYL